jgi:hypothetical protein
VTNRIVKGVRSGWTFHLYEDKHLVEYDKEARKQFKAWWKKRVKALGTLAAGSESSAEAAWIASARASIL